jgi:hypothetical protein
MDSLYSFNEKGIVEVTAPDGTKLTVAQSLELFRRQILENMRLMTKESAANLALVYAVKQFAVPQMQASHWEAVGELLQSSQDTPQNNALKDLTEMMLGHEIERKQPEPQPEPEPVVKEEPKKLEEPVKEDPLPEPDPVVVEPVIEQVPTEPSVDPEPVPPAQEQPVEAPPERVSDESPPVVEPPSEQPIKE